MQTRASSAVASAHPPAYYRATRIASPRALLTVKRFTGGWTSSLEAEIRLGGGIDRWFTRQLRPASVDDSFYLRSAGWWPANTASVQELRRRQDAGIEPLWEAVCNYQRWSLVRRIHSRRQVQETMAAFWEDHLHVPATGEAQGFFRADYGRLIRRLALGRFDALLAAAITHPAMGVYLSNAESTRSAPNENLGRELLELHTVGRAAGFTEEDVKNSARILTGYRVDLWRSWQVHYDPASHWTGPVKVLGFTHSNQLPDGRPVTAAYLKYLAHHPSTARTIARKLAVRFVSDSPSAALVQQLATVYLRNGTAIAPVLSALVGSPEFLRSAGTKTRTPEEDLVATCRALGATLYRPTADASAANQILWQSCGIGLGPFGWPRPDGRPDNAAAWSSVSRVLKSFDTHYAMSGRWWPREGIGYRTPARWLPTPRIRFDLLVDHLSRTILGQRCTATLLQAACEATGLSRYASITRAHDLIRYGMPQLLTVFLDSPTHFRR